MVGDVPPQSETQIAHQCQFDLQVVCVLRSKEKSRNPCKYDAICYMRHANHEKFWKEERGDSITTQCISDVYEELAHTVSENDFFYSVVGVYVKCGTDAMEKDWDKLFFESMGGKSHVLCACRMCPLVPTNRSVGAKRKCNARVDTTGLGSLDEDAGSLCQRLEAYVCSNPLCTTRLCRRCFDALPTETTTTVRSPDVEMLFANDVDHESDCSERGDSDAETVAEAAFIDDSDHDDGHVNEALEDVCNSGFYTISSP